MGGWNKQGTSLGMGGGVINENIVGKGYAEASSALNVFGNDCNDVIAAAARRLDHPLPAR